jgi:hypothetical protein
MFVGDTTTSSAMPRLLTPRISSGE